MYNRNVSAVAVLNSDVIIGKINRQIFELDEDERIDITEILNYHECEPMEAAARISELLSVRYEVIFDLL